MSLLVVVSLSVVVDCLVILVVVLCFFVCWLSFGVRGCSLLCVVDCCLLFVVCG